MLSNVLLESRGVSKTYTGISNPWAALLHALFPRIAPKSDEHTVLEDIDLIISRGETVGIIGRNGAGKTTLLGILGGVIQATGGIVKRHGKIATLLGLTAGFNHDFSGRENAYLFCSIHGLSKTEAGKLLPRIEGFADLGEYFDLPLRTYSSGMQSRLAFSCAVHVSADVIIIDETLAVGDANFKLKCYDKIKEMQAMGQTFLLVSHSQNLVANYCTRVIVLESGKEVFDGDTVEGLEIYKKIRLAAQSLNFKKSRIHKSKQEENLERKLLLSNFNYDEKITDGGRKVGVVSAVLSTKDTIASPAINWGIRTSQGIIVSQFDGIERGNMPLLQNGQSRNIEFIFDLIMQPGRYYLSATTYELNADIAIPQETYQNVLSFDVAGEHGGGIVNLNMQLKVHSNIAVPHSD
jgi:ABC-type polysaccharide/polyol phosphate transport system ATPase subunit